MAKLLYQEPVPLPMENRYHYGLYFYHYQISKFGLWFVWLRYQLMSLLHDSPDLSWKDAKTLAGDNGMYLTKIWCLTGPLWTNIYYLK